MIRIWHVGAWGRNAGDRCIQWSMGERLTRCGAEDYHDSVSIRWIDIQSGPFTPHIGEVNRLADLLVIGGGGLLWDKPELNSRSGWQWDVTLEEMWAIDVPVAVYAIGWTQFPYGDPTGEDGRLIESVAALYDMAASFTVRNEYTRRRLGVCGESSVASMPVISDPARFMSAESQYRWPMKGLDDGYIALCWASDKPLWRFPVEEIQQHFTLAVVEAVTRASQRYGLPVVLVEHIRGMDEEFWLRLAKRNIRTLRYSERATQTGAPRLAALYRDATVVLSARKHGLIVPWGQGVPAIGLGDMPEVMEMCRDEGMPYVPSYGTAEDVEQAIEVAMTDRERLVEALQARSAMLSIKSRAVEKVMLEHRRTRVSA